MQLTSYFSDVVFTRQQQSLTQLEGNTMELDAIEQLVLHGQQYPEVNMSMRALRTNNTTVALWQALDYSSRKMLLRLLNITYSSSETATPVLDSYEKGIPDFAPYHALGESTPQGQWEEPSGSHYSGSSDSDEGSDDEGNATPDAVAALVQSSTFKSLLEQWRICERTGRPFMEAVPLVQLGALVAQVVALEEEERAMLLRYIPAEVASVMCSFGILPAPAPCAEASHGAAVEGHTAHRRPSGGKHPPAATVSPNPAAVLPSVDKAREVHAATRSAGILTPKQPLHPPSCRAELESKSEATCTAAGPLLPASRPTLPVDYHSESEFPAERLSSLVPRLRTVVDGGLLQLVQREVLNHLAQARGTFLSVVLGGESLDIEKPPSIVRRAINEHMTAQLAV
jgi:hypothetical protein